MNDETQKLAMFYDNMGRELFRKIAQIETPAEEAKDDNDSAEFGTGGKLCLTSLVDKLTKKGKK